MGLKAKKLKAAENTTNKIILSLKNIKNSKNDNHSSLSSRNPNGKK
jgi:hypothetical protein